MNRKKFERRSLELTPEQWQALEAQAAALGTTPPSGSKAGRPSWRSLIKAISNGDIILSIKETHESDDNVQPTDQTDHA